MINEADVVAGHYTEEAFLIERFLEIVNKKMIKVPFELNGAQLRVDRAIASRRLRRQLIRFLLPKNRRRGISSLITARFLIKALTKKNVQAGIVSKTEKDTTKLFEKIKYFLKHIKTSPPTTQYDSRGEVTFPENDSYLAVFTAGAKDVARGLDLNHVHFSEPAFYEHGKSLFASIGQTVPLEGEIFAESTGNGALTWWHRICLRAKKGTSIGPDKQRYALLFFGWLEDKDCILEMTPEETALFMKTVPDHQFEELDFLEKFPQATPEQLAWRRFKIEYEFDFDIPLFQQEHPATFDESFKKAHQSYFHKYRFIESERWTQLSKFSYILEGHPNPDLTYALGADVAAGVESDSSVIEIACLETNEQVFEYVSNIVAPNDFAHVIYDAGKQFGFPLAVVEANNHGHVTLDNLVNDTKYPREQIYWDEAYATNITEAGHTTNRRTKPLLIGTLRTELAQPDGLVLYSPELIGEMSTFTEELKADGDEHDDRVLALAHMNKAMNETRGKFVPADNRDRLIKGPGDFAVIFDPSRYHMNSQGRIPNQAAYVDYGISNFLN